MKYKKLKLRVLLILWFGLTSLQAQISVNATGGNASGSAGTVVYSLGQVVYTTNSGTNGSISQGVQQLFEISVVTAVEESKGINLSVLVYPNPTTENLTLNIVDFDIAKLMYELYDMNGKLLQSKKITEKQTKIEMSNLMPTTYFIKVAKENKEVKTFKVIKY